MGVPEHHCDPKRSPYFTFVQATTTTSTTLEPSQSYVKYPNFSSPCPNFEILSSVSQSDCPTHGPAVLIATAENVCSDFRVFVDNDNDCTKGAIVQWTCCNTAIPVNVLIINDNFGFCSDELTEVNLLSGKLNSTQLNGSCLNGEFTTQPPTATTRPPDTNPPTVTTTSTTTAGPCCWNQHSNGLVISSFTDISISFPDSVVGTEELKRNVIIIGNGTKSLTGFSNEGEVRGYSYNETNDVWTEFENFVIGQSANLKLGTAIALNPKSTFLAAGKPNSTALMYGQVEGFDITDNNSNGQLQFTAQGDISENIRLKWFGSNGVEVDGKSGDKFGSALDVSMNKVVIVGAPEFSDQGDNGSTVDGVGAVAVYDFSQSDSDQRARQVGNTIIAGGSYYSDESYANPIDDGEKYDDYRGEFLNAHFGKSVGIDQDGTKIVVGAPAFSNIGNRPRTDCGKVFAYELIDKNFTDVEKDDDGMKWKPLPIQNSEGNENGEFHGYSVAMSKDGNVIAVGAPYWTNENSNDSDYRQGRVTVYELVREQRETGSGTVVDKYYKIRGQKIVGTHKGCLFGWSVKLSVDGGMLAVSSPLAHVTGGIASDDDGIVEVFKYNLDSGYVQDQCDIEASLEDKQFGTAFDLTNKGDKVAIGYSTGKTEFWKHTCFTNPPPPPEPPDCPSVDTPAPGGWCIGPDGGMVGDAYSNMDCEVYSIVDLEGCLVDTECVCVTTSTTTCDPNCLPECDPNCTTTTCDPNCLPECDPECTTTTCDPNCLPTCDPSCTTTCDPNCLPVCNPSCTTTEPPCPPGTPTDCPNCSPGPFYFERIYDDSGNVISCACRCGLKPEGPCRVNPDANDPSDTPVCPDPNFGDCPEDGETGCLFDQSGRPDESACGVLGDDPEPEERAEYEECIADIQSQQASYDECMLDVEARGDVSDFTASQCDQLAQDHGGDICGTYYFLRSTCVLKISYDCEVVDWTSGENSGTTCVCQESSAEWILCKDCNSTGDIYSCDSSPTICTFTAQSDQYCSTLRDRSGEETFSSIPTFEDNPLP